jgi:hypothetical protein
MNALFSIFEARCGQNGSKYRKNVFINESFNSMWHSLRGQHYILYMAFSIGSELLSC